MCKKDNPCIYRTLDFQIGQMDLFYMFSVILKFHVAESEQYLYYVHKVWKDIASAFISLYVCIVHVIVHDAKWCSLDPQSS